MDERINEGYVITDSIHIGQMEFVLGKNNAAPAMYVTWACRDKDNYFWGHYFSNPLEAKKDLLGRAGKELAYQMQQDKRARGEEHAIECGR